MGTFFGMSPCRFIGYMFTKFEQIYAELSSRGTRKRMVAAWGVDSHTVAAAGKEV